MIKIIYKTTLFFISCITILTSCKKDFINPNAATSGEILATREGMFRYSLSLVQYYSTSNLSPLIITTGCTSREIKGISTLQNVIDIEAGGKNLPSDNNNLVNLFANSIRTMAAAEDIIANAPSVLASDAATLSGIMANAKLYKAMAIGALATGFEKCPVEADRNGKAVFVTRVAALQRAITLLDEAATLITTTAPSAEFKTKILGGTNFDLQNTIYAYKARYSLMAGDYAAAKSAASLVSLTSKSIFVYSSTSSNPGWNSLGVSPPYRPRDYFGLPIGFYDAADARRNFYTTTPIFTSGTDVLRTMTGFFSTQISQIPVYLPDEMRLIKAEAILRGTGLGTLTDAVTEINAVRTQTTGDPFGVNAGLPAYAGTVDAPSLLLEVYKQRCAELYLQGLRLEDNRRFGRPTPPNIPTSTDERTRDYYPYPATERALNPNTPADPAI
jgi:starch-binding outer membrane protein, SusD/RagB family